MLNKMESFFNSRWFEPRHKTKVHIVQIVLVVIIICLSGARMATLPRNRPRSRSDTIAITMSAKSVVILLYELFTSHVSRLKKWGSLKAYAILNTLEILFWFAVAVLMLMGITKSCVGTSCALGWVIIVLAFVLAAFASWTSAVTILDYLYFKTYGHGRGAALPTQMNTLVYSESSPSPSTRK